MLMSSLGYLVTNRVKLTERGTKISPPNSNQVRSNLADDLGYKTKFSSLEIGLRSTNNYVVGKIDKQ